MTESNDSTLGTIEYRFTKFLERLNSIYPDPSPLISSKTYEHKFLENICEMRLCEQNAVILKPNTFYYFTVDENCEKCLALAPN